MKEEQDQEKDLIQYIDIKKDEKEKKGKRFEYYIGIIFSKELKCQKFLQGIDYSLHEEIMTIISQIASNQKDIEQDEIKKLQDILIQYNKETNILLSNYHDLGQISSHTESISDKTDILSSYNTKSGENMNKANEKSINEIKILIIRIMKI